MSQVVFDVVAEDPKKPEIADDVEKVGVQKHRSKNGQNRRRNWILRGAVKRASEVLGDEPELKNEGIEMPRSLKLHWKLKEHEHQHVQRNNEIIHIRRAEPWLIVAYGKHVGFLVRLNFAIFKLSSVVSQQPAGFLPTSSAAR